MSSSETAEEAAEILLVEDNPADVELTLRAFRKHGLNARIKVVGDGLEAVQYLFGEGPYAGRRSEDAPKLVLLDLKLPVLDGVEVLRRIRADPRTHNIPVVALTSSVLDRDVLETYELGVNSYIVKPVDFQQFNEAARVIGSYWLLLNKAPPAGRSGSWRP
ncbi:MAG TPA: response regulator [Candidatus Limnocylindrales bacterium]|nr:response regulator [Candidatus Limnocylindrales bacterium]